MAHADARTDPVYRFANTINTPDGGTHLTGFKTALTRVFNKGETKKLIEELGNLLLVRIPAKNHARHAVGINVPKVVAFGVEFATRQGNDNAPLLLVAPVFNFTKNRSSCVDGSCVIPTTSST